MHWIVGEDVEQWGSPSFASETINLEQLLWRIIWQYQEMHFA